MQIEGFANDPNARAHEVSKVRAQRVWMYGQDYKDFGITEDCKKCQHNQRWGYNKSRMLHSERCRTRMEVALATTEAGRKRLAAAEERINQRLAKEVEESDARPERGIEAAVPDIRVDDDLFGNPDGDPLTQPHKTATLGQRDQPRPVPISKLDLRQITGAGCLVVPTGDGGRRVDV